MRYLITFTCYGSHLHGDERGSIDRHHNTVETPLAPASQPRIQMKQTLMDQPPYLLDLERRRTVLAAIKEVCQHRRWTLLAAQVRTNHVHSVVEAEARPELIMNSFKSYSSRALNALGIDSPERKSWARHGSTRWLFKDTNVQEAIRYVVQEQGDPMEVYCSDLL
jgi:REP element-mobilizing transposase RayT